MVLVFLVNCYIEMTIGKMIATNEDLPQDGQKDKTSPEKLIRTSYFHPVEQILQIQTQ